MNRKYCLISLLAVVISSADVAPTEEFFGPFSNWLNAKTGYGAVGNGTSDDTPKLQAALNALKTDVTSKVLYIPAGTYLINSTLTLASVRNIAIIGEDPATTVIKWNGAVNCDMFLARAVAYSRFGRISWDGSGKANRGWLHAWRGGDFFPTGMEFADMIFHDMKIGIQGGEYPSPAGNPQSTLAETAIIRCQFLRCSESGIFLNDWNTADIWIRQCYFQDNYYGIRGNPAQFSVYNSVFKSDTLDIYQQTYATFCGIRNNYSSGSKSFFSGINSPTISGNIIDITRSSSTWTILLSGAEALMTDNIIRSWQGVTAAPVRANNSKLVSVGNIYTVSNPITNTSSSIRVIGDTTVSYSSLTITEPQLPSTPARFTGTIIEPTAFTGAAIQSAIITAGTNINNGQKSAVHLKYGNYAVSSQILVPANVDMCIVGDGGVLADAVPATNLRFTGASTSSTILLKGPSKARLKDFYISGGNANGIIAEDVDQPGSRIFLDQYMSLYGNTDRGTYIDGLDNTVIEAWNHQSCGNGGILVKGGPLTAAGQNTTAKLCVYGGSGGSWQSNPSFDVQNNGRLLVNDLWFETGSSRTPVFNLTSASSGTLVVNSGKYQFHSGAATGGTTMGVNGFKGICAMICTESFDPLFTITGNEPLQNFLFLCSRIAPNGGGTSASDPGGNVVITATGGTNISMYGDYWTQMTPAPRDVGTPTDSWLLQMLSLIRTSKSLTQLSALPAGVTDIRLWRIGVGIASKGLYAYVKNIGSSVQQSSLKGIDAAPASRVRSVIPGLSNVIIPSDIRQISLFDLSGRTIESFVIRNTIERRIAKEYIAKKMSHGMMIIKLVP